MKFLVVKSVFCPNRDYYDTTIKSIVKNNIFIELLQRKEKKLCIDTLFIGWINRYNDLFNSFIEVYKMKYNDIYRDLWPLNYGKYELYNRMIDFVRSNNNYDFILYMDHDIYFDFTCIDLFNSISDLQNCKINDKNLGIIAFNQKLDVRHQKDMYENTLSFSNFTLCYPSRDGSIASGAFIIYPDVLTQIEYFDKITIYGLDDYYLAKRLTDRQYINVVIGNLYVIHPYDSNDRYTVWKKNHLLKLINGERNSYYSEIQNSVNFWSDSSISSATSTIQ